MKTLHQLHQAHDNLQTGLSLCLVLTQTSQSPGSRKFFFYLKKKMQNNVRSDKIVEKIQGPSCGGHTVM